MPKTFFHTGLESDLFQYELKFYLSGKMLKSKHALVWQTVLPETVFTVVSVPLPEEVHRSKVRNLVRKSVDEKKAKGYLWFVHFYPATVANEQND